MPCPQVRDGSVAATAAAAATDDLQPQSTWPRLIRAVLVTPWTKLSTLASICMGWLATCGGAARPGSEAVGAGG